MRDAMLLSAVKAALADLRELPLGYTKNLPPRRGLVEFPHPPPYTYRRPRAGEVTATRESGMRPILSGSASRFPVYGEPRFPGGYRYGFGTRGFKAASRSPAVRGPSLLARQLQPGAQSHDPYAGTYGSKQPGLVVRPVTRGRPAALPVTFDPNKRGYWQDYTPNYRDAWGNPRRTDEPVIQNTNRGAAYYIRRSENSLRDPRNYPPPQPPIGGPGTFTGFPAPPGRVNIYGQHPDPWNNPEIPQPPARSSFLSPARPRF